MSNKDKFKVTKSHNWTTIKRTPEWFNLQTNTVKNKSKSFELTESESISDIDKRGHLEGKESREKKWVREEITELVKKRGDNVKDWWNTGCGRNTSHIMRRYKCQWCLHLDNVSQLCRKHF